MTFLAPSNQFKEPIDIGPEPTKDPSPQRAKVLDFAKVVHLSALVERVRRAADEAALYAQSKVYAPDMVRDFEHTAEVLQFITSSLGELGSAFKLIISETAADLSSTIPPPPAVVGMPKLGGGRDPYTPFGESPAAGAQGASGTPGGLPEGRGGVSPPSLSDGAAEGSES